MAAETPSAIPEKISPDFGEPVTVSSARIGPTGGEVTIADTGGPLDGFEIQVPAGALEAESPFEISFRELPPDGLGDDVTALAPLILVDNGGVVAAVPMTIMLPAHVPVGHFAMGFYRDPATGELEAIPTLPSG